MAVANIVYVTRFLHVICKPSVCTYDDQESKVLELINCILKHQHLSANFETSTLKC
jgi:hypothetical protein